MNLGGILDGLGSLVSGTGGASSGHYEALASVLAVGGGVLKTVDADNKGPDDIAGDFCISGAKILNAIGSGERSKAKLAIASAREVLDNLERIVTDAQD